MQDTETSRKRIAWLGAEFVVIAAGIVVGLAVDGARASRADSALRADYLEQFSSELSQNEIRTSVHQRWSVTARRHLETLLGPSAGETLDSAALALVHLTARSSLAIYDATYQSVISRGDNRILDFALQGDLQFTYDQLLSWQDVFDSPPQGFLARARRVVPIEVFRERNAWASECKLDGEGCQLSAAATVAAREAVRRFRSEEGWREETNEYLLWIEEYANGVSGHPHLIDLVLGHIDEFR